MLHLCPDVRLHMIEPNNLHMITSKTWQQKMMGKKLNGSLSLCDRSPHDWLLDGRGLTISHAKLTPFADLLNLLVLASPNACNDFLNITVMSEYYNMISRWFPTHPKLNSIVRWNWWWQSSVSFHWVSCPIIKIDIMMVTIWVQFLWWCWWCSPQVRTLHWTVTLPELNQFLLRSSYKRAL